MLTLKLKLKYGALICSTALLASVVVPVLSQEASPTQTIVEESHPMKPPPADTLGTINYRCAKNEQPYYDRLPKDEAITGGIFGDYSIQGKSNKYISWCGIVRSVTANQKKDGADLLIEMKGFDGAQDSHMMTVGWHGSGDFIAKLNNNNAPIQPLCLVRVYGTVTKYENDQPIVNAKYIRIWPWGLFNFMDHGAQSGNAAWLKLSRANPNKIYQPFPNFQYYVDRLGPPSKDQRFLGLSKQRVPDRISDTQIQQSKDPIQLYVQRAISRLNTQYVTGAIEDSNEAIKLDPDCGPAYGLRAMSRLEIGDYTGALADVNYALQLFPMSSPSYSTRGRIYSALNKHQEAVSDFSMAIKLDPTKWTRYGSRGDSYMALGKFKEAAEDYKAYLEAEPKDKEIADKLTAAKAKLGSTSHK